MSGTVGRELEAVHTSMQEGVIAINGQEQIITVNKAAAKIFDFSPGNVENKACAGGGQKL